MRKLTIKQPHTRAKVIFDAAIIPIGKGRPRASGKGGHVRMYTPDKTRAWEKEFVEIAQEAVGEITLDEPLQVAIVAVFPRVKRLKAGARVPHTVKPDVDNVTKIVLDGLQAAGIIADDKLVYSLKVECWYANSNEKPHLEIGIW